MTGYRRKNSNSIWNIGALYAAGAIFQGGREARIYRGKKIIKVNL